jgi:hypothetical protein
MANEKWNLTWVSPIKKTWIEEKARVMEGDLVVTGIVSPNTPPMLEFGQSGCKYLYKAENENLKLVKEAGLQLLPVPSGIEVSPVMRDRS